MDVLQDLCYLHDPDPSNRFFAFDMYGTLVRARFGNLDDMFETFYRLFPDADPEDVQREYESFYD